MIMQFKSKLNVRTCIKFINTERLIGRLGSTAYDIPAKKPAGKAYTAWFFFKYR